MKKVVDPPLPFYRECQEHSRKIWRNLTERGAAGGRKLDVSFYDSLGLGVFVSKPSLAHYKILVPDGCFARYYLLAFLFMTAHNIPRTGRILKSPRDLEDYPLHIPERLRCIFAPDSAYVAQVESLLREHCTDFVVPQFLREATVASTLFLAEHEMAHVERFHFEMKALLDDGGHPVFHYGSSVGMSKREILEGFEAHADQLAAEYVAAGLLAAMETAAEAGSDPHEKMLHYAIGLVILVTLLDSKARSLNAQGDTYYPHPLVRWNLIYGAIAEALPREYAKPFVETARDAQQVVSNFLCDIYFHECIRDEKRNIRRPDMSTGAIGNLAEDCSNFGQSVLYEHIIRAAERGRRSTFLADSLGFAVSMKDEFNATPQERAIIWMHKLRHANARASNGE
jgi:hypothetical protein